MQQLDTRANSSPSWKQVMLPFLLLIGIKELLLWNDFKQRLGTSKFSGFSVNPSFFMDRHEDLASLEVAFSNQEIDEVVKAMPNDKSPGPYGFNNEFFEKVLANS